MHWLALTAAVACIFGAAIVRGYSGFGFSLLAIVSISLFLPPAKIVPTIFMMEVAASLYLLPGVWRDIHWRALRWLALGCLLATPLGVYALAKVPAAPLTLALGVFVFGAALLLAKGYSLHRMPGAAFTFAVGAASGLFNGAFGVGGPPVVLFFFSSPAGVAAGRASIIAFFVLTDVTGLVWQGWNGLLSWATLVRAAIFLPPFAAGVWLGNRGFRGADPAAFRRWTLRLLMVLAILTGVRAALELI